MSNELRIKDMEGKIEQLNSVSPSFCLAKWLTSTTLLYNGMTHSCHHPVQHKIRVEDIKRNYRGLHNTPTKMAARMDMRNGVQTSECDYCWRSENTGSGHFSDRHYKSTSSHMGIWTRFDEVVASDVGQHIVPAYLEVAFDSTCNFKCAYCTPDVSSRWMEEVQHHGPYRLRNGNHHDLNWLQSSGRMPIHHTQENPYIEAFWTWWPEIKQQVDTFRITGGEPLLSKHTWRVLDELSADLLNGVGRKDLKLSINTNLGVPKQLVQRLCLRMSELALDLKETVIYTSAEAVGPQAEYCRFGMVWDEFNDNVRTVLQNTPYNVPIHFMTTVNVFSVSTFDEFLYWISDLRKTFNKDIGNSRIGFNVNYLRWPGFLNITQLPQQTKDEFAANLTDAVKHIQAQENPLGRMYLEEVDQVGRLIAFMQNEKPDVKTYQDFAPFIDQYDDRRGTSFQRTFPELEAYYQQSIRGY